MRISDWSSDVCSSDLVYFSLTALAAVAYGFAGMGGFDAVNHAMTTVSNAGFSTRDTSLAGFSPAVHWVDRQSVVSGTSVSVRVDLGGRRIIKKKKSLKKPLPTSFKTINNITNQ